jgi:hypothetical protein
MPIVGVTVSEQGEAIQRLAVSTKVAIGEVVRGKDSSYPRKLDHFIFLRKNGTSLEWEGDPVLAKHFGAECREFFIVLLNDESENVFRTEYAWWSKTEKLCWGDGRNAVRRTDKNPEGAPWLPCGDTCPDLDAGSCKPSGDLYFVLADFPRLGSVCRLHTTSYRSIRQIHSALEQIRTVTGGRLAGIRCKLVVRPEKAAYYDSKDQKKKTTTIYALNIELSADDMRKLVSEMTQYARLFEQTRKLLGDGRKVEYVVDEEAEVERAPEIAEEFFPASGLAPAAGVQQPVRKSAAESPAQPAAPGNSNAPEYITAEQRKSLYKVCMEQGWSNEQVKTILRDRFQVEASTAIRPEQYDEIVKFFDGGYVATDEDIPF